jgi:hypothetical protein
MMKAAEQSYQEVRIEISGIILSDIKEPLLHDLTNIQIYFERFPLYSTISS